MAHKIYIRKPEGFNKETIEYYKTFAEIVPEKECDIVVINDFTPIKTKKIVACNSTGLDHIKAKKIISLRGEDLSDFTAVAELTLSMAIMLTRLFKNEEIKGKILGLIGCGRIGQQFKEMADKMNMRVFCYDNEAHSNNDLKGLLEASDIVSLHITSDEENRNFMDKQVFKRMKKGAIFLNSARPWLVDEEALKWALNNKLAAAWYDFDMFQHPKLITTSHLGGTTKESRKQSELLIAKQIKNYD